MQENELIEIVDDEGGSIDNQPNSDENAND